MDIEITDAELAKRKSNGTVIICHSCKTVKNKIIMVAYKPGGVSAVHHQFCGECAKLLNACAPCNSNR